MSAIMKLKQARNPEQIAEELEPLAVSLATLADQAAASIQNLEQASKQQAADWSKAQEEAARTTRQAAATVAEQAKTLQQATASLQEAAQEIEQAQRGQFWTLATVALVSAILAGLLATASVLWLVPAPTVQNTLDPKAVAEHLRAPLLDALKRR